MKKSVLIFCSICLCFILASCGHKIRYNGEQIINIVLTEEYVLNVYSNDDLTFTSDNDLYVTVSPDGVIRGKNIGEANITISNSHEEITIHVIVSLFEEPTLDFGISPENIVALYGEPRFNLGDSIYRYGGGNDWYSFAAWQMDFFFTNNRYFESDVYLRDDLDKRIDEYLNENFYHYQDLTDTVSGKVTYLYLNSPNPEDATVIVGKQYNAGPYQDILLAYAPFEYESQNRNDFIYRNRENE